MKFNDSMLRNWETLNQALMAGDEALAVELFNAELNGQKRPTFIKRIYSRINKLRAIRERQVLHGKG